MGHGHDDNATWYASTQGQTLLSLQLQLDFIWYELTTFPGYGLADLKATTNVTEATVVFETDFEGCGTCDQSTRIMYAENVLAAFGSDSADAGPGGDAGASADASGVGTPCTVTTTGESGVCMETSACAALANHVSTPGYCPGPDDVQCCTGPAAASSSDAGTSTDAGAPPPTVDGGTSVPSPDAGETGHVLDAGSPARGADGGGGSLADGGAADGGVLDGGASGCSTTREGASSSGGAFWLAAIGWVAARLRRRSRPSVGRSAAASSPRCPLDTGVEARP